MPPTPHAASPHRRILHGVAERAMVARGLLPTFSEAALAEGMIVGSDNYLYGVTKQGGTNNRAGIIISQGDIANLLRLRDHDAQPLHDLLDIRLRLGVPALRRQCA